MERLLRLIPVIAQHDSPLLITGETGTGKDLLGESMHKASPRSREPFVRFSCGPMPTELLDAELFGRVLDNGECKAGRFQQAQGTLYLSGDRGPAPDPADKPGPLSERGHHPARGRGPAGACFGGSWPPPPSHRKNWSDARLREDLFHRIAAIRLHLPRLTERGEDLGFCSTTS